jgi:phosphoglycerol transferase MdoB-like AlkP superfamily enzyme
VARSGFETLASVLVRRGYETLFLYGGQGIFDQMRGFFLGNGFQAFIEEDDFDSPGFQSAWGVSDEDLFHRTNRELQSRWEAGRPFLATLLTVSLHSPWEFPPGRAPELPADTPVPPGFERAELANFLYADFAIGEFVREARQLPYSRDTLFVFVGDHGVHLRGRTLLPAEEYRVPALFLAPEHLRPRTIDAISSQLDIAPTIMGILGGTYRSTFFGRDVLARDAAEGMAIMVYRKRDYGVLRAGRLTVIPAAGDPRAYRLEGAAEAAPVAFTRSHGEASRDGLALLQAAECLAEHGLYTSERSPGSPSACGGTSDSGY